MKLLIDVNQLLWNGPILVMLFGTHVYFTLRLRLVQRKIGYGISLSLSDGSKNKKGFGRFGSLTTTLAATLGTGNIIGISTAVFLGGPGAVFWCWLTGLLGMATTYAETFLCHHFRYQGHGGPMYILHFLLHKKTLALLYSAALTLSAFFIGCTTQSNAITETCHQVFSLPPATCAIITAFFVGLILMQGRKWIENVSIAIVPTLWRMSSLSHSARRLSSALSEINFFLRFCTAFHRWRFYRIHDGKSHPLWRGKGAFYKRIRAWHNRPDCRPLLRR